MRWILCYSWVNTQENWLNFTATCWRRWKTFFFVGELKIDLKRPLQRLKGKLVFASKSDSNYSFWQQTLAGIVISLKKYINMAQCNSNFWKKLKKVKDSLWDKQSLTLNLITLVFSKRRFSQTLTVVLFGSAIDTYSNLWSAGVLTKVQKKQKKWW